QPDDPDTPDHEQWVGGVTPEQHALDVAAWEMAEPVPYEAMTWDAWRFANYAALRRVGYESNDQQFEMMHDDVKNGTSTWLEAQNVIKVQYPKGH
ncbi:hypothetical protein, partial [Enterovibrio norvegicus]|uniref:hypothetical protein n=1 Tax=Enterovibrio norvegicus TaxID=188144 RepID=UPI00054E10D2